MQGAVQPTSRAGLTYLGDDFFYKSLVDKPKKWSSIERYSSVMLLGIDIVFAHQLNLSIELLKTFVVIIALNQI